MKINYPLFILFVGLSLSSFGQSNCISPVGDTVYTEDGFNIVKDISILSQTIPSALRNGYSEEEISKVILSHYGQCSVSRSGDTIYYENGFDIKEFISAIQYTPQEILKAGGSIDYLISYGMDAKSLYGLRYEGGIIVFLDTTNHTGFILEDQKNALYMNWESAIARSENLLVNGYDDWRTPSIDELKVLSPQLGNDPKGDLLFFWSSEEIDESSALSYLLGTDKGFQMNKGTEHQSLSVRTFEYPTSD